MEKSYMYRIYPNKKQQELIQKTFGCVRFVYNYFLDLRIKEYKENGTTVGCYATIGLLTKLKQDNTWLKEPDKDSLQNSLKNLDAAYRKFFKEHTGFPKFKTKKDRHKSYRTNCVYNNIRIEGRAIKLPKLGYVKMRDKRIPEGRILNATVIQEPNGHYYCSICCTDIMPAAYARTNKNVGIDLGIVDFAILSDGFKIGNPRFYEKSEKKLARLQREMQRKTIGGANWEKARIKLAKIHRRIANQRKDFLHKLTTQIVREYDFIAIEDLDVSAMKQTSFSIRNKRINDVSFYEFRRQLTYKTQWYGKYLSVIDRYYPSSQICNVCGHRDGKKPEKIRRWTCHNCGSTVDRDLNAACNILNEGLRIAS